MWMAVLYFQWLRASVLSLFKPASKIGAHIEETYDFQDFWCEEVSLKDKMEMFHRNILNANVLWFYDHPFCFLCCVCDLPIH
jgi:hypothetical protein